MIRSVAIHLTCCFFAGIAVAKEIDFAVDIQPIFAQHCLECHGPDEQEAGLRLDVRSSAVQESETGHRPIVPGDPTLSEILVRLTSDDADLRMPPEGDRLDRHEIDRVRQWIKQGAAFTRHWAYRPLKKPKLPKIVDSHWCQNEIDYFVLQGLEMDGITPSQAASRSTLVKRLHYDLLGLPPDPTVVEAFVADRRRDAYPHLVDQILTSPHFGERWGRHWLDKARYADSDGYEKDNPRPNAWRYRDWVINAINSDLAFDEFTIQQLAGDLIPNASNNERLATAFHRQTLTNTEGGTDREQWRVAAVMDRTETLGTVWLGLTVGCARCHNHKYDQISQNEYYQLYAFFNNADESTFDLDKNEKVRVVQQRTKDVRHTHVLRRGEFLEPEHEVFTGTLNTLPDYYNRSGDDSSGDRLDLAGWLVSGKNPLPPRVAVNHIWKNLFGSGLVRTVNDFGIRGESPTHPQLLDWLATELIDNGWSRKQLIRTIVLSNTYRQASKHRPEISDADPQNRRLHRQNRYRVEAEVIRDIALSAAGLLSRRIGGASVFPPIPSSITDLTYNSSFKWKTSQGEDRYRRGMYTFFKRTAPHPNLTTFDCPNSNVTCVERESSNTPIAALVTLNNVVYVEAARAFARRLIAVDSSDLDRIHHAIRLLTARPAKDREVSTLLKLLADSQAYYTDHPDKVVALTDRDDGTPELAGWTVVARVLLNLDEFITRE